MTFLIVTKSDAVWEKRNVMAVRFWRKNENKFKMVFQYVKLRFTPFINSYVANALRKESFKSICPN